MGANEKEGRDFPFGKGSGMAAVTSGIGLTTCRISIQDILLSLRTMGQHREIDHNN